MKAFTLLRFIFTCLVIVSCTSDNIDEPINYPSFSNEIEVSINGLTFDAMEPFISPDGNYLFFNSLNDGIVTKLYYATKIDDTTFYFISEISVNSWLKL